MSTSPKFQAPDLDIHWFPGHMKKTERMIEENLKSIDVLVEITDARIPESGRNPVLERIAASKPRLLLLNKRDCADDAVTRLWLEHYKGRGITAIACDCRSGAGLSGLFPLLKKAAGIRKYNSAIRVMAAGIPNSGKSSFINRVAGSRKTAVGDRPGVTRGKQWVSCKGDSKSPAVEILDLPGILPPKLDDKQAGLYLAYTGAVKDAVMDTHALAASLAELLAQRHADKLAARYKLDGAAISHQSGTDILVNIAKARGMVVSGGVPDAQRAAEALLDEFRGGKLGRITLEVPEAPDNI